MTRKSPVIMCILRGVAGGGGSWGARDPPFVGLLLSQRKRHDNILAVKAIVEKPTFFKIFFFVKYFRQRLLSLVNMGLHAAIIRHDNLVSSLCDPPLWKILATPLYTLFFKLLIRQKKLGNWPNTSVKLLKTLVNRTRAQPLVQLGDCK